MPTTPTTPTMPTIKTDEDTTEEPNAEPKLILGCRIKDSDIRGLPPAGGFFATDREQILWLRAQFENAAFRANVLRGRIKKLMEQKSDLEVQITHLTDELHTRKRKLDADDGDQ